MTRYMTDDEIDALLDRTEYTEHGVAIGAGAQTDQDARRAAQATQRQRHAMRRTVAP